MMEKKTNNECVEGYPLTREKKLMLLRWLRDGFIPKIEADRLIKEVGDPPLEEIKAEIHRLTMGKADEMCGWFIADGGCRFCHRDGTLRDKPLPL